MWVVLDDMGRERVWVAGAWRFPLLELAVTLAKKD